MENTTSKILRYTGWGIIVLGTIGSIIIGMNMESMIAFLAGVLSCWFFGLIFCGLGEIIVILDDTRNYQLAMNRKFEDYLENIGQTKRKEDHEEREELPYI